MKPIKITVDLQGQEIERNAFINMLNSIDDLEKNTDHKVDVNIINGNIDLNTILEISKHNEVSIEDSTIFLDENSKEEADLSHIEMTNVEFTNNLK